MPYEAALGAKPEAILRPTSLEQLSGMVTTAAANGQSVIPWGGGTGQTYGYLPRRVDTVLEMTGLNRVLAHEFADLTVTVEAGITLAEVQEALAQHNQYLPLDPPNPERATIGGILACNAFGSGVVGVGSVRDWLIGITVVDAAGRIVRGGGKVVKNVTGYDLPKIHVGALGTLGIIAEATFKVAPRPEATRVGVFTCVNPDFSTRLHDETAPAMSLLRSTPLGAVLAVLYSGMAKVVDSELTRAANIAAECREVGLSALPTGMLPPFGETLPESSLILRFSGPRSSSTRRHNGIADIGNWEMMDTYPGTGQTDVYLKPRSDPRKALNDSIVWATGNQASLSVLHASPEIRRSGLPLWHPEPPAMPWMRRLKATLDPKQILNPGRFVGEI
ncbi:MAG: FAD-binding oxidoreductase [Capsulimonadales bacterium]|nr:FAD-binding oxidoreductase [Capsulimonadales bacterium]